MSRGGRAPIYGVAFLALCALLGALHVSAQRRPRTRTHAHGAESASLRPTVTTHSIAGGDVYRLHAFHIPLAGAQFGVADVRMTREITPVLHREQATLVFNGGYFDTRMRPEGLVISAGRTVSSYTPRLGGGVLTIRNGRASLHDGETFTPTQLWGVDFGVQCKPRLIVDRAVNIRTDDGRRADRTALCLRNDGTQLDVYIARSENMRGADGPTLQSFAQTLQGLGCEQALNLDGGPSTGVAWRQDNEVRVLPPRGSIRHVFTVKIPAP